MMGSTQKALSVGRDMLQNCIIINYSTYDKMKELLDNNDLGGVASLLEYQKNMASIKHPYYPNYIIDFKNFNNKFIPYSKPNTKEALESMPQSLKGKFKIPEKYSRFSSFKEILEFSRNTQTEIEIDIIEIKKMLGDVEDPYQFESQLLKDENVKWTIKAQEFPPAMPFKIVIGNSEKVFEYILLRADSFYNNELILSNKEQNVRIHFEFQFDMGNQSMGFSVKINKDHINDLKAHLDLLQIFKLTLNKEWLYIYSLEAEKEISRGKLDTSDYKSDFITIDEEIKFIENLILIESKFDKKIIIPENICEDDLSYINYLAQAIKQGFYEEEFDIFQINITVLKDTLENKDKLKSELTGLKCVMQNTEIPIFGEVYKLKSITRIYKSVKIKNYDRIIKKLEVAEEGDVLKIELIPDEEKLFTDSFEFY